MHSLPKRNISPALSLPPNTGRGEGASSSPSCSLITAQQHALGPAQNADSRMPTQQPVPINSHLLPHC